MLLFGCRSPELFIHNQGCRHVNQLTIYEKKKKKHDRRKSLATPQSQDLLSYLGTNVLG